MSPQLFYKSAFVVTLVAFVKKTSQCQWSPASQEKRIGFVGFGLCFDLLGPKFSIRARRLRKGASPCAVPNWSEMVMKKYYIDGGHVGDGGTQCNYV